MKTLVIGASTNPERYSNIAARLLKSHGHNVYLLGKSEGEVADETIHTVPQAFTDVDTVSVYVKPEISNQLADYILSLNPKRIIFNPGAENQLLQTKAESAGIYTENACTLVLLQTGQYQQYPSVGKNG